VGLSGGFGLNVPRQQVAGGGQLDLGYSPPGRLILVRLAAAAQGASRQAGNFTLFPVLVRLEAGLRRGTGRLYGQVTVGGGVGIVRSDTTRVDGPAQHVTVSPVVSASLAGGLRLGLGWSLRLEVVPQVFLIQQETAVAATGPTLTDGPRLTLAVLLGIERAFSP
jgi:hypothetical protein